MAHMVHVLYSPQGHRSMYVLRALERHVTPHSGVNSWVVLSFRRESATALVSLNSALNMSMPWDTWRKETQGHEPSLHYPSRRESWSGQRVFDSSPEVDTQREGS